MPGNAKHRLRAVGRYGWLVLALLWPVIFVAGCQNAPSMFNPASPSARMISDLGWQLIAIAAVVFVVVEALLVYAIIRFRHRGETEEPRQIHGHTKLEIAWTALPGIILIGVVWVTVQTMASLLPVPSDAVRVRVIGHQWWWEVEYPDLGIVTANEIHVPVGANVRVDLRTADVIHSFWQAELGPKMDVLPEHDNTTWFKAEREKSYRGFCAEFCGVQHANMGFMVVAENQTAFDAWVQSQRQAAPAPGEQTAQQGAQAFITSGCGGCHTVAGTQAQGRAGPNLSHIGSRQMIGANVLPNTTGDMARWITNPQEVKPGNLMPVLPLDPERVSQLTAYLATLK